LHGFIPCAIIAKYLDSINNDSTIVGKLDNHGKPPLPGLNATAITYDLCVSQCGTGQEPFQWTAFSQQFSSWLLPWLALLLQLPFGANDKLDNLESMLLTLGSPTLAAYSLALTVLNGRWVAQLFSNYRYPNAKNAARILSNLQQSPLRVDKDDVLLASLIMLPQNHNWWEELVEWLGCPHTWSISAATSIAWVIIAYIFTIVDYFSQDAQNALNPNGDGPGSIGSLWLWLLPIVVGWLQFSSKCDSIRLYQAVDRANSMAHVANSTSQPIKAEVVSRKRAIDLARSELDTARLDEYSTPPIYNYARFLPWVQSVVVVSDAFGIISERDHHHDPVPGIEWPDGGDTLTALQVGNYSLPRPGSVYGHPRHKWGLDSSVLCRMFVASALALILQWGTTGGAIIIVWFTPAIGEHILPLSSPIRCRVLTVVLLLGLGCQSVSYIIYACLSTLVWTMLLTSSILTYYSTNTPAHSSRGHVTRVRIAHWLSIFLRRLGKLIAILNAIWIVVIGFFQISSFYNRCFCNSHMMGFGKGAYVIISLVSDHLGSIRAAQIGGFFFAAAVAMSFAGLVRLMIITPPS
jgi:hypothetical protein